MRLTKKIVYIFTLATGMSAATYATDCGAPPLDQPVLPLKQVISPEELKNARDKTIQFSESVDAYMACMDQQGQKLLPYMTKKQQTRWEEDLTQVHENRRQIQIALNDLIRAYREQDSTK